MIKAEDEIPPKKVKLRWYLRLVLVLAPSFVFVYWANNYLPRWLESDFGYFFVEFLLLIAFGLAAWNAGLLRSVQTKSKVALLEFGLIVILVIWFAQQFGTSCEMHFCISSTSLPGAYSGYSKFTDPEFLSAIGVWLAVAITEEFTFRGYVFREISQGLKRRGGSIAALLLSAAVFASFHLTLRSTQIGAPSTDSFLITLFLAGVSYGLCYWLTDFNLSLTIFLHFYYDGFLGTLNFNPFDPILQYRPLVDFVLVPSIVVIVLHQALKALQLALKAKSLSKRPDHPATKMPSTLKKSKLLSSLHGGLHGILIEEHSQVHSKSQRETGQPSRKGW